MRNTDSAVAVIEEIKDVTVRKGVLDLLRAVSQLKGKVKLLMIGSGRLKYKIKAEGRRLGILERIRILNPFPSSQVPYYINCMDCLVLPSRTTKKMEGTIWKGID